MIPGDYLQPECSGCDMLASMHSHPADAIFHYNCSEEGVRVCKAAFARHRRGPEGTPGIALPVRVSETTLKELIDCGILNMNTDYMALVQTALQNEDYVAAALYRRLRELKLQKRGE